MKEHLRLTRFANNPVLEPNPAVSWESRVTTNPGAWYDPEKREVLMLYRASGCDAEHRIYFGLARSRDGYRFERDSELPAFGPSEDGFDGGCVEDPRVVKFGEWFYVTYATRAYPPGEYWIPAAERTWSEPDRPSDFPWCLRSNATATGLALTRDFKTWKRAGRMTSPTLDDRDVVIFPEKLHGRYVRLHRPMQWAGPGYETAEPAIWISFSEDLLEWGDSQLLAKGTLDWEGGKIGINTPPIRTADGWLTLYHGVGQDKRYRLGAFLLDLEEPWRILGRSSSYLLQPEQPYETVGYYNGCVFPCGKVVIGEELFVYYGAADKYVCGATCNLGSLIEDLKTSGPEGR
jgi:predicted GH43/DUF377 family glycosyl hydrolase